MIGKVNYIGIGIILLLAIFSRFGSKISTNLENVTAVKRTFSATSNIENFPPFLSNDIVCELQTNLLFNGKTEYVAGYVPTIAKLICNELDKSDLGENFAHSLPLTLYWRGFSEYRMGNSSSAIEIWSKEPVIAPYFGLIGISYFHSGDSATALQFFNLAEQANPIFDPTREQEYRFHCLSLFEQEIWAQALAQCERAVVATPKTNASHRVLAIVQINKGLFQKAIKNLTLYIDDVHSIQGRPYYWRARAHRESGNWEDSINDYWQLISLEPTYSQGYFEIIQTYHLLDSILCTDLINLKKMIEENRIHVPNSDALSYLGEKNQCFSTQN